MAETQTIATKDDFHRERSRFLDGYAELEAALSTNPSATKDKGLLKQLAELKAIRNDLVHSQLKFVQLEGELQAVVVNTEHVGQPARSARILLLSDFTRLKGKLGQVVARTGKAALA